VGKRRFGELVESLGVARNILSARLKKLVHDGILELEPARDGSAHKEYVLTEKGRGLIVALIALKQWGDRWAIPDDYSALKLVERATGEEIATVEIRSADGRQLTPQDIALAWTPRSDA
jgi:DNA-binding HxlR family transcriptional regulator